MTYIPNPNRYEKSDYQRAGDSGLLLPPISFGLWQNFGENKDLSTERAILQRAFDRGVTHFDLANNYGPPFGSAEKNFGEILKTDFAGLRDELVISTKAGWNMWEGPYGDHGSRKYLLASLDQSLERMGLDYVDIYYHHRPDPDTPLRESMGALHQAVVSGRALYAGISSYSAKRTVEAARILADLGTPLLIHQPSYSMLNRWIEGGLLDELENLGVGCIAFSVLGQGLLTSRYLNGIPSDSRAATSDSLPGDHLSKENLERVRQLNSIAERRGQTLSQMAISWALRDPRMTSTLIGASSVAQLDENLDALNNRSFTDKELEEIDLYATESGINHWANESKI